MGRLRLALIGVLIGADLAILLGTPFLETVGDVPRRLGYAFGHLDTDPAAAALLLVRLLLGGVLLAAILDQIRVFARRPVPLPAPDPPGWTDLRVRERPENPLPASMAVRDRWHDPPAWSWVSREGLRHVQVGDTVWQVDRFTVTVESSIDFDEALRRIDVHDAFRQLANDAEDFERRRAVVMALSAGLHWPFLGRSSFGLSTTRITAAEVSALDGVFVLRNQTPPNGGSQAAPPDLAYLVAPTTSATRLVEHDPDLVVALVEHLDPPTPGPRDGHDLRRRLTAAAARVPPDPAARPFGGISLAPPSQEAVFRVQPADRSQSDRANTHDHRHIVSVAKINRIYLSTRTPPGLPIATAFKQVTAELWADRPELVRSVRALPAEAEPVVLAEPVLAESVVAEPVMGAGSAVVDSGLAVDPEVAAEPGLVAEPVVAEPGSAPERAAAAGPGRWKPRRRWRPSRRDSGTRDSGGAVSGPSDKPVRMLAKLYVRISSQVVTYCLGPGPHRPGTGSHGGLRSPADAEPPLAKIASRARIFCANQPNIGQNWRSWPGIQSKFRPAPGNLWCRSHDFIMHPRTGGLHSEELCMTTLRAPVIALAASVLVGGGFAAGVGVMRWSAPAAAPDSLVLAGASVSATGASATSVPCPVVSSAPTTKPTAAPTSSKVPAKTPSSATSTPAASSSKVPAGTGKAAKRLVADGFAALGAGTTGGAAGKTVTVTTAAALKQYAGAADPYVIRVSGLLTVSGQIEVASNKTIVGAASGAGLTGGGLNVRKVKNVIIADLTISKAKGTDAVSVWGSNHVLVTHNDFSSDLSHGKDFYDGLVDITQGSDDVTVSYNRFHDHFKVVLIGHSDNNGAVDTGKLHVTLHHNSFTNVGSRLPSLRFGTGHVYNNVFTNVQSSAIHSRMGAVILAQNNVFTKTKNPYVTNADSKEPGTILTDPSPAPAWPYKFTLDAASAVAGMVSAQAGPN